MLRYTDDLSSTHLTRQSKLFGLIINEKMQICTASGFHVLRPIPESLFILRCFTMHAFRDYLQIFEYSSIKFSPYGRRLAEASLPTWLRLSVTFIAYEIFMRLTKLTFNLAPVMDTGWGWGTPKSAKMVTDGPGVLILT